MQLLQTLCLFKKLLGCRDDYREVDSLVSMVVLKGDIVDILCCVELQCVKVDVVGRLVRIYHGIVKAQRATIGAAHLYCVHRLEVVHWEC